MFSRLSDSNKDVQESHHSRRSIRPSSKTISDNNQDGREAFVKIVSRLRSAIPPRMNTWKRNSTPKPFALSIFGNWDVSYSPIQYSDESHASIYQSIHSSGQSSKVSRHSVFKTACSITIQTPEKIECFSSTNHHFQSASEASDDESVVQCKRPRINYNDEDEKTNKRFKFSDLHGKPVKNLVEIFAAVEEGDITV